MNLRDLRMEDVAHALGHVTVVPQPNYRGMTEARAVDLNATLSGIGHAEALNLVAILATRCATLRESSPHLTRKSTPLTELWDARLVDAKVVADLKRIAAELRGVA